MKTRFSLMQLPLLRKMGVAFFALAITSICANASTITPANALNTIVTLAPVAADVVSFVDNNLLTTPVRKVSAVPEPGSGVLVGLGLAAIAAAVRKHRLKPRA